MARLTRSPRIGDARQNPMQEETVLLVDEEPVLASECLLFRSEQIVKLLPEWPRFKAANISHHHEHRVLHRPIGGLAKVPQPPGERNVDIPSDEVELLIDDSRLVIGLERREQKHALQGEAASRAVLRVEIDVLEARRQLLAGLKDAQVLAAVEVKVTVDKLKEVITA